MYSDMDSLGSEGYDNCHRRAIQQCLSNTGVEMAGGAWEACVCSSSESRVGGALGGRYGNHGYVVMTMVMFFWRKMDLFKTQTRQRHLWKHCGIYGSPKSKRLDEACSTRTIRKVERKTEENHSGQGKTKTLKGRSPQ